MKFLASCFFLLFFLSVSGQSDSSKRGSLAGFPVAYYTPESGLGFGVLGLYNFSWKNDTIGAQRSGLRLGAAYTLRKQILFYLPYNLFLQNDNWRLNGELGYYDYVYFFFGVGNPPGSHDQKKEAFEISFPRLRTTLLKKVRPNLFLGLRYSFDYYFDLQTETNSKIVLFDLEGQQAGTNSGVGPSLLYDTRDDVFYTRKGIYLDVNATLDDPVLLSDYRFFRMYVDGRYFYSLSSKSVLAANVYYQQNTGQVPFYHLSMIGGPNRLRGQFEGEFRDHFAWQGQIEWRQEFLKNWGFAAFAGLGWVAPTWSSWQLQNQKFGGGVGLRYKLDKKDHVNIRVDVGYGNGKFWPYVTVGEAF